MLQRPVDHALVEPSLDRFDRAPPALSERCPCGAALTPEGGVVYRLGMPPACAPCAAAPRRRPKTRPYMFGRGYRTSR